MLDLSGKLERVLCDADAEGSITAWYVHVADLCHREDAAGTLTCYHAEAQAGAGRLAGVVAQTPGANVAETRAGPAGVADDLIRNTKWMGDHKAVVSPAAIFRGQPAP